MYHKAYGIIETLAPLHVGASAGEETGNLNLIFRDQFTQTGIIPGSSIRGRFRADMRLKRQLWLEKELRSQGVEIPDPTQQEFVEVLADGKKKKLTRLQWLEQQAAKKSLKPSQTIDENHWYGNSADGGDTTEALVKFEYASLVWLPVFCPGQPIVWVTCPWLLKRYQQITRRPTATESDGKLNLAPLPTIYTASANIPAREVEKTENGRTEKVRVLFFNLGFLKIKHTADLKGWIPTGANIPSDKLLVVADNDMSMIHDMALYRQSRVKLADDQKKVDGGAFFNVEALPEGSVFVFPVAMKDKAWKPFNKPSEELYFGGLESIGFGHCSVTLQEVNE